MLRLTRWCWAGVAAVSLLPFACASKFSSEEGGHGGAPNAGGDSAASAGLESSSGRGGSAEGGRPASNGGRATGSSGRANSNGGRAEASGGVGPSSSAGRGAQGDNPGTAGATDAGSPDEGGAPGNAGMPGSGGAPQDPISHDSLVYWFSADQGVTTTGGGAVSKWLDRSGNDRNAVQLSGGSRPELGTFGGGSAPALVFDGDDDYLSLPPLVSSFEDGLTFFAVARASADVYCMPLVELSNGSEIDDVNLGRVNTSFQYEVFDDFVAGDDGAFPSGEPRLAEMVHAASGDAVLLLNGVATGVGTLDPPANVTREQAFIGRSLYAGCTTWAGEIAEIILYARTLEDDERRSVERYLANKWSCCGD